MKSKKYIVSFFAWCVGAIAVRISVAGFNPIGIGVFSAVMSAPLIRWPAFPIMLISIFTCWSLMTSVKYGLVMGAIAVIACIGRDKKTRVNEAFGASMGALMYGAMELADRLMAGDGQTPYGMLALVTLLTFSSSIVTSRILEAIMISGRKMSGRQQGREEANIYEEKIKMIASAFDSISKSIANMSSREAKDDLMVNCISSTEPPDEEDPVELINNIWRGRLMESKEAIVLQLREMSKILKDCMTSSYMFVHMDEEQERQLVNKLKAMGVTVRRAVMLNGRRGINELNITLKAGKNKCVTAKELENTVSLCMGKRYRLSGDGGRLLKTEYAAYNLVEAPNYFVLHGVVRYGKDGSKISGDNFTCVDLKSGQTLLSVSDGMGHGLKAYKESEMVLTLLEELMEGGFTEEAALKLINSVFIVDTADINPTSVDMGIIDLYSGICEFMKIGASLSFVKRRGWIEAISSHSMPIGSETSVDMETSTKKLYDGDFVIMMSDGVVEAVDSDNKEAYISDIIMDIHTNNPQEMAQSIMDRIREESEGQYTDDMLVMVAGIWDKCA